MARIEDTLVIQDDTGGAGGGRISPTPTAGYRQDGVVIPANTYNYVNTNKENFNKYTLDTDSIGWSRTLYGEDNNCGSDPWRKFISYDKYWGTSTISNLEPDRKKLTQKGTFPQFYNYGDGAFTAVSAWIYFKLSNDKLIIWKDNGSKWEYGAADFYDKTLPRYLFVDLQGGGGGGSTPATFFESYINSIGMSVNYLAYLGGSGGGSGARIVFLVDLKKASQYRAIVGAGGAGGKKDGTRSKDGEASKLQVLVNNEWQDILIAGGGKRGDYEQTSIGGELEADTHGGAAGYCEVKASATNFGWVIYQRNGSSGGNGSKTADLPGPHWGTYEPHNGGRCASSTIYASNSVDECNGDPSHRILTADAQAGGTHGTKQGWEKWAGGGGGASSFGGGGKGGNPADGAGSNGQSGKGYGAGGGGGAWILNYFTPGGAGQGGLVAFYA